MKKPFVPIDFKSPVSEKYFATFEDLDGNIGQLIGPRQRA